MSILLPSPALAADEFFRQTKEYFAPDPFLQPDFSGGGFTQSQTIAVPPGRNGVQPDLKLSYSSQSIGEGSLFGAGWSLNIPYIERLNKLGSDKLYSQPKANTFFSSSISGELLPLGTTTPANSLLSASTISALAQKPSHYRHLSLLEDPLFPTEEKIETTDDSAINIDASSSTPPVEETSSPTTSTTTTEELLSELSTNALTESSTSSDEILTIEIDEATTTPIEETVKEKEESLEKIKEDHEKIIITEESASTTILEIPVPENEKVGLEHIADSIKDLPAHTRANRKGRAIAQIGNIEKTRVGDYFIEIKSMEPIEGGLQVFARAWDENDQPIGFGADGTVEIERFRFFNPPILVEDPKGDIVQTWTDDINGEVKQRKLKEDRRAALLQSLAHTIAVKKEKFSAEHIIEGTVGNTTDTYYPNADTESTSVDGGVSNENSSWTTGHDATAGSGVGANDTASDDDVRTQRYETGGFFTIRRLFFLFDTAAIPDTDTISSATYSMYVTGVNNDDNDGDDWLTIVQSSPAANTAIVSNDYDQDGAITNPTEGTSDRKDLTSIASSAYLNFALNSTGLGWVSKTGVTKLGVREGHDVINSSFIGGADRINRVMVKMADQAGSANDPKLVVEHSAAPANPSNLLVNDSINPSNISATSSYFSAIHINASTTALATSYEIQISTSTSFALPLYWDSGKQTLSSSTPTNVRSPNIFSTTTFAVDGTTYYWRIKFWDQTGAEGSWSTGADYFSTQINGEYMAKVDDGSFMHYMISDNKWTAYDKRGNFYRFGNSLTAQVVSTATSSEIFRWMLEEMRDPNGNMISYTYATSSVMSGYASQRYPYKITYTNNGGGGNVSEIEFVWENRTDVATSSWSGFPLVTNQRLKEILVRTNGQLTHRYVLSYTTGDNGVRSLLSSLQESGWSSTAGTTTLPAVQYTYSRSTPSFTQVTDSTKWQLPGPGYLFAGNLGDDQGRRLVDVTGDGLPDISGGFINTGSTWATSSIGFPLDPKDPGVRIGDINGDGLIDIMRSYHTLNPVASFQSVYLGQSGGTWVQETARWTPPLFFNEADIYQNITDKSVRLVDINGDGLADLTGNSGTYINNASQWVLQSQWVFPDETLIHNGQDNGVRIVDINGDGLADVLVAHGNLNAGTAKAVYLNTGKTWELAPSWSIPSGYFVEALGDQGWRFADINGDGLADITGPGDYVNTGSGWVSTTGSFPVNPVRTYQSWWSKDLGVSIDDINADGLADVVISRDSFEDCSCNSSDKRVWLKNGMKGDLLTRITNEKGGVTNITYKGSAQLADDGTQENPSLQINLITVKAVGSDPGFAGATATTTYSHKGGLYYYASTTERQFAGFASTTKTNALGYTVRTQFHQGNGSDSAHGEYNDNVAKAGKPFLIETLDGTTTTANIFSRIINKWARADYGDGRNFTKLIQSIKQTFDGDGTHRDTAQSTTYDDTTGNPTESINYGEVTGSSDGTFTDIGTDKASTTSTYAASSTNSVMSLPSRELVVDQSGNTVKDTRWYYDTQSLGTVIKGNTTKTESLISGSIYLNTQKTYDGYGNVLTSTDPRGNVTTFVYDTYNLYPATSTNALSQSRTFTYNYANGKVATTTDENGRVSKTDYDGLGRTTKEWQPDFTTPSTLVALNDYTYTDSTSTPSSMFKRTYLSTATSTDSYAYFDGLGRSIQSKREAEAVNGWITKDTQYNAIGSVDRDSLPYFTSASTYSTATTAPALFTNYRYDPLGRIKTVSDVFGTTTNTSNDWWMRVTDALGNKKDMIKDAYGNLAQVVEWPTSTTSATTTYAWNLLGKMTKLTDALGNIRNFTYDTLGRLTGSEDLHASGDTTFGTTSRQYDLASNLIQQYSPLGLATNYTYDVLNRVTSENSTTTTSLTDIVYRYDTCTNGKGRLCEVNANNAATTTYAYNPIGLTTTEAKKIGATWATTSTSYFRNGQTDTLTYPNGQQLANIYNDAGDLNRVFSLSLGSTTWRKVIESTNYGPTGQPTFIDYGNNTMTWFTYDQSKLYRLTRKLTVSTSTISGVPETLILN